ncbi:MAG: methyltransferase [Chitinivibrionales bacterium]|nr:methyltransferase [Chitinivibrionales bacterium]
MTDSIFPVFSHYQAAVLLAARRSGRQSAISSTDLGVSSSEAVLYGDHVSFAGGTTLTWQQVERIQSNTEACFLLHDGTLEIVRRYSDRNGHSYHLVPTEDAPALMISGFPMHRIKGITPLAAALKMIGHLVPITGSFLDTATGLGYTAIEAAKTAGRVVTVEINPMAQEMAQINPWSRDLFNNPKISQIIGDVAEEINKFPPESFNAIMHDPPSFSLAGDLYSGAFYRQAYQKLKPKGKMFHYVGDPATTSGKRVTKGVVKRLGEAGFQKVVLHSDAFGVVCYK